MNQRNSGASRMNGIYEYTLRSTSKPAKGRRSVEIDCTHVHLGFTMRSKGVPSTPNESISDGERRPLLAIAADNAMRCFASRAHSVYTYWEISRRNIRRIISEKRY